MKHNASQPVPVLATPTDIGSLLRNLPEPPSRPLEPGIPHPDTAIAEWMRRSPAFAAEEDLYPALLLFAAHHGNALKADPAQKESAEDYLKACIEERAHLTALCAAIPCDMRIYELDLDTPASCTDNGAQAMDEDGMIRAASYGMMAVDSGAGLLCAGAFGAGSQEASRALLKAVDTRGLDALGAHGGFELAALAGAVLAARLAGLSMILERIQGLAVFRLLADINPGSCDHCVLALESGEYAEALTESWPLPAPLFLSDTKGADPGICAALALAAAGGDSGLRADPLRAA